MQLPTSPLTILVEAYLSTKDEDMSQEEMVELCDVLEHLFTAVNCRRNARCQSITEGLIIDRMWDQVASARQLVEDGGHSRIVRDRKIFEEKLLASWNQKRE